MRTYETKYATVHVKTDPDTVYQVFNRVIEFYVKHEAFSGEVLMQADDPQIDAAPFLSDLVDEVIKFDVEWKD